jgi:HSP20 family molecular chaperone IbpA
VSGSRSVKEVSGPVKVHQMELSRGCFSRTLELPFEVPVDALEIEYENGLLEITMPKPKQNN